MVSSDSPTSLFLLLLFPALLLNNIILVPASSSHHSLQHKTIGESGKRREDSDEGVRVLGRGLLTSFKETPSGGNVTFDCSPSGPCISCLYSEKNDEKYRCSETGYRIPLKCVETGNGSKDKESKKMQKTHSAIENTDDSSTVERGSVDYITYRSCIPAVNEEKLSVLGFEGLMLGLLLVSGFVIFLRRKQSAAISGAVRVPTSSRF